MLVTFKNVCPDSKFIHENECLNESFLYVTHMLYTSESLVLKVPRKFPLLKGVGQIYGPRRIHFVIVIVLLIIWEPRSVKILSETRVELLKKKKKCRR